MVRTALMVTFLTLVGCQGEVPALRLVASDDAYVLAERLSANFVRQRAERVSVSWSSAHHGVRRVCDSLADGVLLVGETPAIPGCVLEEALLAQDRLVVLANDRSLRRLSTQELAWILAPANRRFADVGGTFPDAPIEVSVLGGASELERLADAVGVAKNELRKDGVTFVGTLVARSGLATAGPRLWVARRSFAVTSGLEHLIVPSSEALGLRTRSWVRLLRRVETTETTPWLRFVERYGASELTALGFEPMLSREPELRTAIAPR